MSSFRRLVLALLALLLAMPALAQTFPALSGRVVDEAGVLDPAAEAALTAKLKQVEDQSGRQLVVATIADLQGYPIEDYGYRLGRSWGIGEKDRNSGIILIVAPNSRKMRIEVGRGLEPYMTDALSGRIIRDQMVPHFKAGDYPGGINAGVDAIIPQLTLPPEEAAKRASEARDQRSSGGDVDLGSIIFWLFIFFFFILPLLRSMFGGKRGRRMGGGPPIILWGPGDWSGGSSGGSSWGDGGFSGGGGDFGGGGASGDW
jgi:uncharacterized protein